MISFRQLLVNDTRANEFIFVLDDCFATASSNPADPIVFDVSTRF